MLCSAAWPRIHKRKEAIADAGPAYPNTTFRRQPSNRTGFSNPGLGDNELRSNWFLFILSRMSLPAKSLVKAYAAVGTVWGAFVYYINRRNGMHGYPYQYTTHDPVGDGTETMAKSRNANLLGPFCLNKSALHGSFWPISTFALGGALALGHPRPNVQHVVLAAHHPNAEVLPRIPSEGAYIRGTA